MLYYSRTKTAYIYIRIIYSKKKSCNYHVLFAIKKLCVLKDVIDRLIIKCNLLYIQYYYFLVKQAFDSIVGNTVVPYRSHKKFFNNNKLMFISILINSTFR